MQGQYLIGTDIGTSSTKSVITDLYGNIQASACENYEVLCPHNAWAEQWPDVWENAVRNTIRMIMKQSGINAKSVAGICISGLYGGSGIPLDEEMQVVRPCIIWMDRRSEDLCVKLRQELDFERLFSITENGIDSYYGYTKMLWIKEHEPDNWRHTKLFLTPNQYIVYKFTGEIVIDRSSAGNLGGIYDMEKCDWSDEMLCALGIPRSILPQRIVDSTEIVGTLTPSAAKDLLLSPGTPVCAGCVDCLASTLSSGVFSCNQAVAVLATSLNWGLLHDTKQTNSQYVTMPYLTKNRSLRYTYGGITTAGALTKWFVNSFYALNGCKVNAKHEERLIFSDLEKAAREIPAGAEGLLMLPYFMGERTPIWDAKARGSLIGLTVKHTSAHVYRSILESVGYALRHVIETFDGSILGQTTCRIVGGGTNSKLWVQILSDITGTKLECMSDGVEAPIGDAFMAGVGTGIFPDFEHIEKWAKSYNVFCPNLQNTQLYLSYYEIYKHIYKMMKEDMHALADLGFALE